MSDPTKRGRGRPRKPLSESATETIAFKVTLAEAATLEALGIGKGGRHKAARDLVRAALKRPT